MTFDLERDLDRLAERGTPREASDVVSRALTGPGTVRIGGRWMLRGAAAALVVALGGAVVWTVVRDDASVETLSTSSDSAVASVGGENGDQQLPASDTPAVVATGADAVAETELLNPLWVVEPTPEQEHLILLAYNTLLDTCMIEAGLEPWGAETDSVELIQQWREQRALHLRFDDPAVISQWGYDYSGPKRNRIGVDTADPTTRECALRAWTLLQDESGDFLNAPAEVSEPYRAYAAALNDAARNSTEPWESCMKALGYANADRTKHPFGWDPAEQATTQLALDDLSCRTQDFREGLIELRTSLTEQWFSESTQLIAELNQRVEAQTAKAQQALNNPSEFLATNDVDLSQLEQLDGP
ncbi:MAG: hypothetical protein AAGF73_07810 [Actinomycetota bacterium]